MACCIIAAMILAQIAETIRRWAVFWGLARPYEGEDADTFLRRLRGWLARPGVRLAVTALVALEIGAFSSWVYFAHGEHLYRLADQTVGAMRGQTIVYAGVCDRSRTHAAREWGRALRGRRALRLENDLAVAVADQPNVFDKSGLSNPRT